MAYKISEIEGIGPVYTEYLGELQINTTEDLLEQAADKKGRKLVSDATGIDTSKILNWVNKADLMRIKGVGSEFSDLLEAAGVDTVKELRNRNAENLHEALNAKNEEKSLVRALPGLSQVEKFIAEAKELDPLVTY